MASRNGSVTAHHAGACALRLSAEEESFLDGALEGLTAREREVVRALCHGGPNDALADRLCVALPTLRTHLMRINQKLGSESKDDIVRFVAGRLLEAYRRGDLPVRGARDHTPASLLESKRAAFRAGVDASPDEGASGNRNHRYR